MATINLILQEGYICGNAANFSGSQAYPHESLVQLGPDLGIVRIECRFSRVPDKAIFTFDGVDVINTGYLGDPAGQAQLTADLAAMGLPPETILDLDGHGFGNATFIFNKTTITSFGVMKMYAPGALTGWYFKVFCPTTETIFYNEEQNTLIQKDNCTSGTGSMVNYKTNAGIFSSLISVADANSIADAERVTNGQNYANREGTCI